MDRTRNRCPVGQVKLTHYPNGVKLYSAGGKGITAAANIPAVNGKFTLQVKPPTGSVLTMERTLPPQLDTVMDLR